MTASSASAALSQGVRPLGDRQGEQRHKPIGVDLEQTLDHATGLARRHAPIEHQQAAEAVADAEVRQRKPGSAGDPGPDQRVSKEMSRSEPVVVERSGGAGSSAACVATISSPGSSASQSSGTSSNAGESNGRSHGPATMNL